MVPVRGYRKKNGTWVQPSARRSPAPRGTRREPVRRRNRVRHRTTATGGFGLFWLLLLIALATWAATWPATAGG